MFVLEHHDEFVGHVSGLVVINGNGIFVFGQFCRSGGTGTGQRNSNRCTSQYGTTNDR